MFKKRPRPRARKSPQSTPAPSASKMEVQYWERHLFQNTFTYKGRSRKVQGWSIKIQLFGHRKTFSLSSSDRKKAAVEACEIYQTIYTQGWDAVGQRRGRANVQSRLLIQMGKSLTPAVALNENHWKLRLVHRPYLEGDSSQNKRELSVRIEHAGISRYFPVRTNDEDDGASEAMRIHRTVVEQGWGVANQKYPRELTVALRWLDDPLAWTYTTFHTKVGADLLPHFPEQDDPAAKYHVAVVEPDAGIRSALVACVNRQDGFKCRAAFLNVTEALREHGRRKRDLVLVNDALPDQPGSACLEELLRIQPTTVGLLYSVFEDSEQLFKSTPGGVTGYMLKRTPTSRIFDPIAEVSGALTSELIAAKTREYFQRLVAAIPTGPSALNLAKLTPREHEVLGLLAKGHLAKQIAESLGISIWTVHGHVKNLFEKLQVHSRTEAVVKFLQK